MGPYDSCVWNCCVDENQLTMLFHVYDLTIAHLSSSAVTEHKNARQSVWFLTPISSHTGKGARVLGHGARFRSK